MMMIENIDDVNLTSFFFVCVPQMSGTGCRRKLSLNGSTNTSSRLVKKHNGFVSSRPCHSHTGPSGEASQMRMVGICAT